MSRFNAEIRLLEASLNQKVKLAQQLEVENAELQQQEQALRTTLETLCGGMSLLMSRSNSQPCSSPLISQAAEAEPAPGQSMMSASALSGSSSSQPCESGSSSVQQGDAGRSSGTTPQEQQLSIMEREVTSESTTITSLTLARLSGSPDRVASYLALTQEQRLQWLAAAVKRLALLLPKYDSLQQYREEADSIVDEIMDRGLTYQWLDPEACVVIQINLVNMETGQQEPAYPPGLWHYVAKRIELSPQQRRSLHALWCRIKTKKADLVAQHEKLLKQLTQLQEQQFQQQQLFAQQAQQLPFRKPGAASTSSRQHSSPRPGPSQQKQQQLQQQVQHGFLAARRQQPPQPTEQVSQQQQQQPHVQAPLQQQQPVVSNTRSPYVSAQSGPEQQQQQQRSPLLDPPLHQDPAAELLLPLASPAQRKVEARLTTLREQLALQTNLLITLQWNMLSKKQIAILEVASWPFLPDAHELCEAFDELGW